MTIVGFRKGEEWIPALMSTVNTSRNHRQSLWCGGDLIEMRINAIGSVE
jgi:hypothetical protein